jgi:exosome complex exonuclease DIS3/RRP44
VKVTLSETHDPLDVKAYETRETNSMVEEFMLLANIWVARCITEAFPRCALLRRHPSPPEASYVQLQAAAKSVGVSLRVGSSKELADSLDEAVDEARPHLNRLLRILTTRCMMQATYFSSCEFAPAEYLHYGLATPIYTHFTSPIRRCLCVSNIAVTFILCCVSLRAHVCILFAATIHWFSL